MLVRQLAFILVSVAVTGASAQQGPSLVADASREVRGTLGARVDEFTIRSVRLGTTRRINIVLPESWSRNPASRKYPVAIVFDGESNMATTAASAGELMRNGMMPELILVGIENVGGARGRVHDLTPPGLSVSGSSLNEGGDQFLDFIEKELLPAVDKQFRGGQPRMLIGHSSGGILATYAAATRPMYRAVISVDAPVTLSHNWLANKLMARATVAGPPLRYVSYEARFGWPDDAWASLTSAAPKSWQLKRESLRLEGHETLYMLGVYLGLREVFSDYSRLATQEKPAATVLPHYAALSESFGTRLIPPQQLLRDVLDDLLAEGRGKDARAAWELYTQGYGAPPDSARLLAELAEAEQRTTPTETVESLLATPFPSPDEARQFIGDWVGDQWMTTSEPRTNRKTLRIRVESGRVIGELLDPGAPPEFATRRIEYLSVTPAGLTYGFLNRMRPRGVVLWEGTLKGDTLSGSQRWGGVAFSYPPGSGMDPGFRYTRVRK